MNVRLFLVISLLLIITLPMLVVSFGTAMFIALSLYIGYGVYRLQCWMVKSSRKLLDKGEK